MFYSLFSTTLLEFQKLLVYCFEWDREILMNAAWIRTWKGQSSIWRYCPSIILERLRKTLSKTASNPVHPKYKSPLHQSAQ
jgi:hypothetical protein